MSDQSSSIIAAYEDALLARIKSQVPDLKTVKTFEGELAEAVEEIAIERVPALYAIYGGAEIGHPDDDTRIRRATWLLLLAARSLRSRHDAARGAYELLDDITGAIDGRRLPDQKSKPSEVTDHLLAGEITPQLAVYQIMIEAELTEYLS